MVTVICSLSGVAFEAKTARAAQHPKIAALKAKANKNGEYNLVLEAIQEVSAGGKLDTIEEFLAAVDSCVEAKKNKTGWVHPVTASRRARREWAEIRSRRASAWRAHEEDIFAAENEPSFNDYWLTLDVNEG